MKDLQLFFTPQSIVIIGVSRDVNKVGHVLFSNIRESGYAGRIYIVNRETQSIAGYLCYASVLDLPQPVDLAIIAVPADSILDMVVQCGKKGIHNILIIT